MSDVTTDAEIAKLKPKDKQYKVYLGRGLHVLVTPSGGKLFRMKFRYNRKEKTLSLGRHPETTLLAANELVTLARRKLWQGIDPSALKQQRKRLMSDRILLQ